MHQQCIKIINESADYLRSTNKSPKILIKLSRNLGDTIHMIPVFKHYKIKYPNCAIAFLTQQCYAGVHINNKDIDYLGLLPNNLSPQDRLALWDPIKNLQGIDLKIIPAIHPFGSVHKCNVWSRKIMTDQVMYNAGIEDCKPLGGRRYTIAITTEDHLWAQHFFKENNINPQHCAMFEYNSYSHEAPWTKEQWSDLVSKINKHGSKLIGFAGLNEGVIPGMIDCRGVSWARTVAIANLVPKMIGVGSGVTMLAAGAEHQPLIIELNVPESVSISTAGYAPSIIVNKATVDKIAALLAKPNSALQTLVNGKNIN